MTEVPSTEPLNSPPPPPPGPMGPPIPDFVMESSSRNGGPASFSSSMASSTISGDNISSFRVPGFMVAGRGGTSEIDINNTSNYPGSELPRAEHTSYTPAMTSMIKRLGSPHNGSYKESIDDVINSGLSDEDSLALIQFMITGDDLVNFTKCLDFYPQHSIAICGGDYGQRAIENNSNKILEHLLKTGLDANSSDEVVVAAMDNPKLSNIKLFVQYGLNMRPHANIGLCRVLAIPGNKEAVDEMIDIFIGLGANPNFKDSLPLVVAFWNSSNIEKMIRLGADINCRKSYGLRYAIRTLRENTMNILLDLDVDVRDLTEEDLVKCVVQFSSSTLEKMTNLGVCFDSIQKIEADPRDDTFIRNKIDFLLGQGMELDKIARIFGYSLRKASKDNSYPFIMQ